MVSNINKLHKYECSIHLVKYNETDYEYEGYVNLIPNIVGSGKTYKDALDDIYKNLEVYINDCVQKGIDYPKIENSDLLRSLNGRITVRLPKNLHSALVRYAKKDGMSINSIIIDATREYITQKNCKDDFFNQLSSFLKENKKK